MSRQPGFRLSLFFLLWIVLATPSFALAYGDPSGGFLFQTLAPLAAVLWGAWMIFAGSILKGFRKAVDRMRGATDKVVDTQQNGE